MRIRLHEHGFDWDQIKVFRWAEFIRKNGVYRALRVNDLTIYVSPTGRITRVFRNGKELK